MDAVIKKTKTFKNCKKTMFNNDFKLCKENCFKKIVSGDFLYWSNTRGT